MASLSSVFFLVVAVTVVAASRPTYQPPAEPGHTVVDECTCFEKGNYYSPIHDCKGFSQRTAFLPKEEQYCPYGTVFNVQKCVCDYRRNTHCPTTCHRPAYRAAASGYDSDSHNTCKAGGNTYATVPGTYCRKFTQAAPGLRPQQHSCQKGLVFDTNLCVCNYPKDTRCYA